MASRQRPATITRWGNLTAGVWIVAEFSMPDINLGATLTCGESGVPVYDTDITYANYVFNPPSPEDFTRLPRAVNNGAISRCE